MTEYDSPDGRAGGNPATPAQPRPHPPVLRVHNVGKSGAGDEEWALRMGGGRVLACTHVRVRMRAHVCVRARPSAGLNSPEAARQCHSAAAPCQRRSGRERRRVEPAAAARVAMHDALLRRACAVDVPSLRASARQGVACAACCNGVGAGVHIAIPSGRVRKGKGYRRRKMWMHARTHRPRGAASQSRGGPGVRACLSTNTSASIAPSVCGCTRPTSASHALIASMHIASACTLT